MTLPQENKWELKSRTWATGGDDYDGCWELTNGKIGICTKDDDDIVEEGLKEAAVALNKTKATFYQMEGERELNLLMENADLYNKLGVQAEKALEREKVLVEALEWALMHIKNCQRINGIKADKLIFSIDQALTNYAGEKEVGNEKQT